VSTLRPSFREDRAEVERRIRGHETNYKRRDNNGGEKEPTAGDTKVVSKVTREIVHQWAFIALHVAAGPSRLGDARPSKPHWEMTGFLAKPRGLFSIS
jgi:hypothetical protein